MKSGDKTKPSMKGPPTLCGVCLKEKCSCQPVVKFYKTGDPKVPLTPEQEQLIATLSKVVSVMLKYAVSR